MIPANPFGVHPLIFGCFTRLILIDIHIRILVMPASTVLFSACLTNIPTKVNRCACII